MAIAEYARGVIAAQRGDTTAVAHGAAVFRAHSDSTHRPDFAAAQLEGLLAQARGDDAKAKERFAHAATFEDRLPVVGPPNLLSSRELLGAAFLRASQPDSAAEQFEKSLAVQPNRAAALLGLARAQRAKGDSAAARSTYAKLLANWHAADADLPALAEVRAGAAPR